MNKADKHSIREVPWLFLNFRNHFGALAEFGILNLGKRRHSGLFNAVRPIIDGSDRQTFLMPATSLWKELTVRTFFSSKTNLPGKLQPEKRQCHNWLPFAMKNLIRHLNNFRTDRPFPVSIKPAVRFGRQNLQRPAPPTRAVAQDINAESPCSPIT